MNAERKELYSEEKASLLDSELSQTLKAIAAAKELAAKTGKAEITLTNILTHALSDELKQLREEENLTQPEPTFAQRNRIITRRQSRRAAGALMRKGYHAVRKHR